MAPSGTWNILCRAEYFAALREGKADDQPYIVLWMKTVEIFLWSCASSNTVRDRFKRLI